MNIRFLPSAARLGLLAAFSSHSVRYSRKRRPGSTRAETERANAETVRRASVEAGGKSSGSLFDIEISGGKFTWKGKEGRQICRT